MIGEGEEGEVSDEIREGRLGVDRQLIRQSRIARSSALDAKGKDTCLMWALIRHPLKIELARRSFVLDVANLATYKWTATKSSHGVQTTVRIQEHQSKPVSQLNLIQEIPQRQ